MTSQEMFQEELQQQAIKFVTTRRAALLLGISVDELRQLSRDSGLGHTEVAGQQEDTYFTYAELRQICLLSVQTIH